jgi:hypothetical protein
VAVVCPPSHAACTLPTMCTAAEAAGLLLRDGSNGQCDFIDGAAQPCEVCETCATPERKAVFVFQYLPEETENVVVSDGSTIRGEIWPSGVHNEGFGYSPLPRARLQGGWGAPQSFEPAILYIPVTVSDTGFPNMITWTIHKPYQNGPITAVSYFRVRTDYSIVMWSQNEGQAVSPYQDIEGSYMGLNEPITIERCYATRGSASNIVVHGVRLNVGGCLRT